MDEDKLQRDIDDIRASIKKIERYLFYKILWSVIKVAIIVLIVVLSYVYLPSFISNFSKIISQQQIIHSIINQ